MSCLFRRDTLYSPTLREVPNLQPRPSPKHSHIIPSSNFIILRNPHKALKYPPKDAATFAEKYVGGFYTYLDMSRVSSKIAKKRAAQITESHLVEFLMMAPPMRRKEPSESDKTERSKKEKEANDGMMKGLVQLYNDCEGDIEAIFQCLGEDPGKALKCKVACTPKPEIAPSLHDTRFFARPDPPSSSSEFALKYLGGEYSYVEVRKQPSKVAVAEAVKKSASAAADDDPMVKALSDLYAAKGGDLTAIFASLGEDPTKALKVR